MGRRRKGRDIDGILLLDKPLGLSSNQALQQARRLFDARKAGHTGSLDPLATGLLPLCFGEATKVSNWLLHADKRYRVTAVFGHETETGDREGRPTRRSTVVTPSRHEIESILAGFIGRQTQIPPMYSALKQDGKPLYELARAGREVERKPRDITIHAIDVVALTATDMTLDVSVSRGTYVRTLVEDIARRWDGAAHVGSLRRTAVGHHDDRAMVTTDDLARLAEQGRAHLDAALVPTSVALAHWPAVRLDSAGVDAIRHGRSVALPAAPSPGHVRIMDAAGGFLGLGESLPTGQLKPVRMFTRTLA